MESLLPDKKYFFDVKIGVIYTVASTCDNPKENFLINCHRSKIYITMIHGQLHHTPNTYHTDTGSQLGAMILPER